MKNSIIYYMCLLITSVPSIVGQVDPSDNSKVTSNFSSWLYRFPPWFEPHNPPPPGEHATPPQYNETSIATNPEEFEILLPSSQPFNEEIVETIVKKELEKISFQDIPQLILEIVKENTTNKPELKFSKPFLESDAQNGEFMPIVPKISFQPTENSKQELTTISGEISTLHGDTPESRSGRKAVHRNIIPSTNLITVPKFPPLPLETSQKSQIGDLLLPLLKSSLSKFVKNQGTSQIELPISKSVRFPGETPIVFPDELQPSAYVGPIQQDSRSISRIPINDFNSINIQDIIRGSSQLKSQFRPIVNVDDKHPQGRWVWISQ